MEEDKNAGEVKKEEVTAKKKCELGPKKILSLVGLVILVVAVFLGYKYKDAGIFDFKRNLTSDEAKTKALDFIENNLVQPGTTVDITKIEKDSGLYRMEIDVNGEQQVTAYMTKDGSQFFPTAMDMDVEKEVVPEEPEVIPTSAKPTVDLYVMSFCPFGNKAEDTLKPAYDLLKDKVDFNFHYIVSTDGKTVNSLHGQKEVDQNEREACVLKNYGKDKWLDFATYVNANCGSDGSCWEAGAKELGISSANVKSCVASQGFALMQADEKASTDAGAQGSPTMIVNGVSTKTVYQYGNSESYKKVICSAFENVPAECDTELSNETSTAQGGSCN